MDAGFFDHGAARMALKGSFLAYEGSLPESYTLPAVRASATVCSLVGHDTSVNWSGHKARTNFQNFTPE